MTNIYKLALQVQDASNLSGVALSFVNDVLPAIRLEPGYAEHGTAYLNSHPVVLMFLDKMVSLTHKGWIHDMDGAISQAYDVANNHVEPLPEATELEPNPLGAILPDRFGLVDTVHNAAGGNVPLTRDQILAQRQADRQAQS